MLKGCISDVWVTSGDVLLVFEASSQTNRVGWPLPSVFHASSKIYDERSTKKTQHPPLVSDWLEYYLFRF